MSVRKKWSILFLLLLFCSSISTCTDSSSSPGKAALSPDALETEATLSEIKIYRAKLDPVFTPENTEYIAKIEKTVSEFTVLAVPNSEKANVVINGEEIETGNPSSAIKMEEESKDIVIEITSEDKLTTMTYKVTVTKTYDLSNINTLSSLLISQGSLNPEFSPSILSYSTTVDNTVNSVFLTPTSDDAKAKIFLNYEEIISGSDSVEIMLNNGDNYLNLLVVAENGDTRNYSINVFRITQLDRIKLKSLNISNVSLSPAFSPNEGSYTAEVSYSINEVTVTPESSYSLAEISVNDSVVQSGESSEPIPLTVGDGNLISIVVTADGESTEYNATITRLAASSVSTLSSLSFSHGILSPEFNPETTSYTLSAGVPEINMTATASHEYSDILLDGTPLNSGETITLSLEQGENPYILTVTSEEGGQTEYNVNITRNENEKPQVLLPEGYMVYGAGRTAVNGRYIDNGEMFDDKKVFSQHKGDYLIAFKNRLMLKDIWRISKKLNTSIYYYFVSSNEDLPPVTGWKRYLANAAAPAPEVQIMNQDDTIYGSPNTGNTVYSNYVFFDPDEDLEGNTEFQWFRCENENDEGTEIEGATGSSYTTTTADSGKYLRLTITPLDEHGYRGDPVKSGTFGPFIDN